MCRHESVRTSLTNLLQESASSSSAPQPTLAKLEPVKSVEQHPFVASIELPHFDDDDDDDYDDDVDGEQKENNEDATTNDRKRRRSRMSTNRREVSSSNKRRPLAQVINTLKDHQQNHRQQLEQEQRFAVDKQMREQNEKDEAQHMRHLSSILDECPPRRPQLSVKSMLRLVVLVKSLESGVKSPLEVSNDEGVRQKQTHSMLSIFSKFFFLIFEKRMQFHTS